MSKSSGLTTSLKKEEMLKALQTTYGAVTRAATIVQITPQTHYNWYKYDEDYRDKVDTLKYQSYEEFKDLVLEAVLTKVKEGNSSIINRSFQTFFAKWADQMERANPYRPRLIPRLNYVDKPGDANL
jgi:hypothetical protein